MRPALSGLVAGAATCRDGEGEVLILGYHRVADLLATPDPDPNALIVDVRRFAAQVKALAGWYDVVPLAEATSEPSGRLGGRRRIVLTLDDGYEDNYTYAFPVLRAAGVPATMFVTTDALGAKAGFWWDRLQQIVWALPPGVIPLPWPLAGSVSVLAHDRVGAYRAFHAAIMPLAPGDRDRVIVELEAALGGAAELPPLPRTLAPEQLVDMSRHGVEIGAHTRSHPVLSRLPADEVRGEIAGSKAVLEELLGRPVPSFAYPFGGPEHFSRETMEMVRTAGYARACSTIEAVNRPGVDAFALGRISVYDWDAGDLMYLLLRSWSRWRREPPPQPAESLDGQGGEPPRRGTAGC